MLVKVVKKIETRGALDITRRALQTCGHCVPLVLKEGQVDGFVGIGHVNDTHGHHVGDGLLQAVAERFAGLIRPSDAAARSGGDEFAVLLHGIREIDNARLVAHQFPAVARTSLDIGGRQVHIGASLGVAMAAQAEGGGKSMLTAVSEQVRQAAASARS